MKEIKSITDKRHDELRHNPEFKSRIKDIIERYTDMYDDWTDYGVAVELTSRDIQIEQLQAQIKELESEKHINEIKAQGIEEFMRDMDLKYLFPPRGDIGDYFGADAVRAYLKKIRTNHD